MSHIYLTSNFQFGFKGLSHIPWLKVNIPMRTHLLLEPAEKPGSSERLFKLYDEWVRKLTLDFVFNFYNIFFSILIIRFFGYLFQGGNVLLTEKSLPMPPYLGLIHQSLRSFTGSLVQWPAKKGLL